MNPAVILSTDKAPPGSYNTGMRVLYIDRLFFLELAADTLLLWAAGRLCGAVRNPLRLLLAGLLGASFAVLALLFPFISRWYGKAAALAGMLLLSYGREKRLGRIALAFLFLCAVYGGVAAAVTFAAGEASGRALLFASLVSLGVCALPFRYSARKGGISVLQLRGEGGEVSLRALRDTGHLLSDPFTGKPVVVASEHAVEQLFSTEQRLALNATSVMPPAERLKRLGSGFCLLPVNTVGGEGLLLAGKVQEARLDGRSLGDGWVAFSGGELRGAGYEAIVSGELD